MTQLKLHDHEKSSHMNSVTGLDEIWMTRKFDDVLL